MRCHTSWPPVGGAAPTLYRATTLRGRGAELGEGDPVRAHASLHGRDGQTVTILSSGQSETEARRRDRSDARAPSHWRPRGQRARRPSHRHITPAALLGASLNPADGGPRRRLSLLEVGTAILVPTNLLHGHLLGDVRPSTYKAWLMDRALVTQMRRLLAAGTSVRLIAVAPGSIVIDVRRITAVRTSPAGSEFAGYRYFGLALDSDASTLRGHYAPVRRQSGVRYLAVTKTGADAFLALP